MKKETKKQSLLTIAKGRDIKEFSKILTKTRESNMTEKQWRNVCKELAAWVKTTEKGQSITKGMLKAGKKAVVAEVKQLQEKSKKFKKSAKKDQKVLQSQLEQEKRDREFAENNAEEVVRDKGFRVLAKIGRASCRERV